MDDRLRRRCRAHGYFVPSGEKCPEAPVPFWGGEPCEMYDPTDEILAAVEERRKDTEFMARLNRIMTDHAGLLERLRTSDKDRSS